MKDLPGRAWVRKGTQVPAGCCTAELAGDKLRVVAGDRVSDSVDIQDWLGGTMQVQGGEDSIGLGTYGKVLTVLTCDAIAEQGDGDDGHVDRSR